MVLLKILHPFDNLGVIPQALPNLVGDRPHETVPEQHANDHSQNHPIHRHCVELVVRTNREHNKENPSRVDEVSSHPEHDQFRPEALVTACKREGEKIRNLHLVLRLLVVDEVAVTRAPGHVVNVAEGVDDEDIHEGGKHEASGEFMDEVSQVLDHGGQDGEELPMEDGADDGDEGGGKGSD